MANTWWPHDHHMTITWWSHDHHTTHLECMMVVSIAPSHGMTFREANSRSYTAHEGAVGGGWEEGGKRKSGRRLGGGWEEAHMHTALTSRDTDDCRYWAISCKFFLSRFSSSYSQQHQPFSHVTIT